MPVISVIVPVYKVEPYLRRCIDSVLNQTFQDFEIILVDDGSPDNCGQICDEYALQDSRIIVKHTENGGVSSARNTGLDAASGEYITFLDADDFIEPRLLEIVLQEIDGFDSVSWSFIYTNVDGFVTSVFRYPAADYHWQDEIEQREFLLRKLFRVKTGWSVDLRLFRKSIIDRFCIRFEPGQTIGEDVGFSMLYMLHSHSTRCLDLPLYYYRIHSDSASGVEYAQPDVEQMLNLARLVESYLEVQGNFRLLKESFPVFFYEFIDEALIRIRAGNRNIKIQQIREYLSADIWNNAFFREKTRSLLRSQKELSYWYGFIRAREIMAEFRYYLDGRMQTYLCEQILIQTMKFVKKLLRKAKRIVGVIYYACDFRHRPHI